MSKEFIESLRRQHWELWAEEDRLFYRYSGKELQKDVIEEIKSKKREILDVLTEEGGRRILPATASQFAMWIAYQLSVKASSAYNIAFAWALDDQINIAQMHKAMEQLLARHASLRTSFLYQDENLFQVIHPEAHAQLDHVDGSEWSMDEIDGYLADYQQRPFDVTKPQLLRILILDGPDAKQRLMIVADHIVVDGLSYTIIIDELNKLYSSGVNRTQAELPAITSNYFDYAHFLHDHLKSPEGEKQKEYWKNKLAGHDFALNLPTDYARPPEMPYLNTSHFFELPAELTEKLKQVAKKTSLNAVLMAAFKILLSRYTGQDDLLVGTPVPGRTMDAAWNRTVGYFVKVVTIRGVVENSMSFEVFAQKIYRDFVETIDHQDYPLFNLVNALQPVRDPSRAQLFQCTFVLQKTWEIDGLADNVSGDAKLWNQFNVKKIDLPLFGEQRDLALEMVDGQKTLQAYLKYNSDIFTPSTIKRLSQNFTTLLESIVRDSSQTIGNLSIQSEQERDLVLIDWNATERDYPKDKTIQQLFEEQVQKTPNNVAVVFEDTSLTYAELNARANQLAHHLRTLGVGAETLVAICCDRSLEIIIGILGILKAGGAYVPLDPAYPKDRLEYMLEDLEAPVVLTQSWLLEQLPESLAQMVMLDNIDTSYPTSNPKSVSTSANLAYVIYTSGSTGKPKGVMIEQHAIVGRLYWYQRYIPLDSTDAYLHQFSFAFDGAVASLFWPILNGAKVIVLSSEAMSDPFALAHSIKLHKVTSLSATPSFALELLNALSDTDKHSIKHMVFAGEALPASTATRALSLLPRIYNFYGPTESSIISTAFHVEKIDRDIIPIGRAVDNTALYILDEALRPVPVGVHGELYIGGNGLARGYLNRSELTAERFIANPFGEGRLYRTGDLCRYHEDGNIEYIGRIDHQVKIRGFRIELEEIESALLSHSDVKEAAVLAREDEPGNKHLVAYYVGTADSSVLRNHVRQSLPDYMTPSYFIALDAMPLTPNGKLDRRALPKPEVGEVRREYVAPSTAVEKKVADIWHSVLKINQIGVNDDFFQIGGNSLLAARLVVQISLAFQKSLPLMELFKAPTIKGVSDYLSKQILSPTAWSPIVKLYGEGIGEPIFFVPGLAALANPFFALSKVMKSDRPCYALESRGYSESRNPHSDMVKMAAYYVSEMVKIQKDGPFCLVGYSFGGALAIEIAHQLIRLGHEISKVVLLDTANYNQIGVRDYAIDTTPDPVMELVNAVCINHTEALKKYTFPKFQFPVTLVRAKGSAENAGDAKLKWGGLINENFDFEISLFSDTHENMLEQVNLTELAEILSEISEKIVC